MGQQIGPHYEPQRPLALYETKSLINIQNMKAQKHERCEWKSKIILFFSIPVNSIFDTSTL